MGEMMQLHLSNGGVCLIDDADFDRFLPIEIRGEIRAIRICDYKWRHKDNERIPYVQTVFNVKGRLACVRLHRLILGAKPGQVVDHVNRDVWDNRRANLRICTTLVNNRNRKFRDKPRDGIYQNPKTGQRMRRQFVDGKETLTLLS